MKMENKIKFYLELKSKKKEMRKAPIGNRIKKGGLLEDKINQAFKKNRAKEILIRTDDYDYDEWERTTEEYHAVRDELIESGILVIDDEGNENIIDS